MTEKRKITFEYDGENLTECRVCGHSIFFKKMASGKLMPVEEDTLESHFANCPAAQNFRSRKGPKQGRVNGLKK